MNDPNNPKRLSAGHFQPATRGPLPVAGFIWLLLSLSLLGQSTVQFPATTVLVSENAGQAVATVRRANDLERIVTVDFATSDATATAGEDYVATAGTLTFAAGQTNQAILVPILNDSRVEGSEALRITLSNPGDGALLGSRISVNIRIADNDTGPHFASALNHTVEDIGSVLLGVHRGDDGDQPVTVDYVTVDGTALAGTDYEATQGTLSFQGDETFKEIPVAILNDGVINPDKSFQVQLSNASSGGVGNPSLATVTIQDPTPVIHRQPTPASQSVSLGAVVKIEVTAKGARMQWQHRVGEAEFTDIPGATGQVIEFDEVTVEQTGEYRFVVSSSTGESVTSQIANVDVDPRFTKITTGPIVNATGIAPVVPAWGDLNRDGFVDLIISDDGNWDTGEAAVPLIFFNQQDGTFRRAAAAEVGPLAHSAVVGGMSNLADYDNDGYLDFYQGHTARCEVWLGGPGGRFTLVDSNIGINQIGGTWGFSWVDYDRDGFLDLHLGYDANNALFRSLGNGSFERTPVSTFPSNPQTEFNSWADYDLDGDEDVILCTHGANRLYRNDGNGQFTDVTTPIIQNSGWNNIWGDYDNDGDLDLFTQGSGLLRNDGHEQFTRLSGADYPQPNFGFWIDYDNDGYLDVNSGRQMWRNNRDGTFAGVPLGSLTSDAATSGGLAWGDYNNDGFPDLVVAGRGLAGTIPTTRMNFLYRNNGNDNHWLMIKPVGTASNRSAIGVKIWAETISWGAPVRLFRCLSGGPMQNDGRVHLGLGDATKVDTLRIEWPSGIVQELMDVAVNQHLEVVESQAVPMLELVIQTFTPRSTTVSCPIAGTYCVLETSVDLENWRKVKVQKSAAGTVRFNHFDASGAPTRFYRVLVP